MYKLRSLVRWVLKKYAHYLLGKKDVYVFSGMRRSGNHACINWMANAVSGKSVELKEVQFRTYLSSDGHIVHFNEVNRLDAFRFLMLIKNAWHLVERAEVVFISLEDYVPEEEGDLYAPPNCERIYISRNLLTILASRITYMIRDTAEGRARIDMNIDPKFFETFRRLLDRDNAWSFEDWLNSKDWRLAFLKQFNLSYDILPQMSEQGGGSSFHGQDKAASTKMTDFDRWKSISWPQRISRMLADHQEFLTKEELMFMEKIWGKQTVQEKKV